MDGPNDLNDMHESILARIRAVPSTCEEIEDYFKVRHQTASARIRELREMAYVADSGERRRTHSGRSAIVWRTFLA